MTGQDRVYRTELTPLDFLARSASVFPDALAVVHGERRLSYRELGRRVNRLASALRAAGVGEDDRVAVLAPNIPALLEAHFGVPLAGGLLVAVNSRLAPAEVAVILGHSRPSVVLVDAELESLLADSDLAGAQVVRIDDSGEPDDPYEALLAGGSPDPIVRVLEDEEEGISINYTSGTTGEPKGVVYTHRGGYLNALGEVIESGMGPGCVYLWTLPMFHCNGWCFPWAVTAVAGTHVCLRKPEPGRIWQAIDQEGVTHYCGAPTVHLGVVNHERAHPLERPVTIVVAGAPPSPTLLGQLGELGFRAVHVYGLTETYGPITVCAQHLDWDDLPADERAGLMARQGVGYTTADPVRVVDNAGQDVPRDGATPGEVVMRGNNVMRGYYRAPALTEDAFRGGWFHSGDIAVWHPDGYIELRDRKKDIIISGGENISTIEVEQAIVRHPAVLEAAVVAMPHERWGERPKAFVTLKPGKEAGEREIIDFCRERIAHFKCPDAVEFCELPKTSTGKVQKFVLREREWGGRERRIN